MPTNGIRMPTASAQVNSAEAHSRSIGISAVLKGTQQGVEEMVLKEQRRRAAAIASRIHSRVVSRGGVSREGTHCNQKVDVVAAAAEKLRELRKVEEELVC